MLDKLNHQKLALYEKRRSPTSFDEFLETLEVDIENILSKMESSSDKHLLCSEDQLTNILCGQLETLDYEFVKEQVHQNGAVDMTVEHLGYKWIGEAKLGTTLQKIFEGVLQLVTRYVKRDSSAGLLIYYQKPKAILEFNKFKTYLESEEWRKAKFAQSDKISSSLSDCFSSPVILDDGDYNFTMKFVKPNGGNVRVKFFAADFYFSPQDASGRTAKYIMEANAKSALLNSFHKWSDSEYCSSNTLEVQEALKLYLSFTSCD